MPQDNNKAAKRQSRSDRRAAEEAAIQAQAAAAAKERKQQTLIGVIVVLIIVAIVAVIGVVVFTNIRRDAQNNIPVNQAYTKLQDVKTKPSRADDKGGILFSKDGYGKKVDGAPTVSVYMDPLCPGCGSFNRQVDPTLKSLVDAGQINLEIHPMSFLDPASTDSYSSRAAGSIAYIADKDNDPNHLMSYLTNIYAEGFQPEEGQNYKPVSNDQLKAQAIKAGISQTVADKAYSGEYKDWLDAINVYTPKREDLWNISGSNKGTMTTPTVTINGQLLDMNEVGTLGLTLKQAVLQSIGLSDAQVGQSGTMPSIGATGKPVALGSK